MPRQDYHYIRNLKWVKNEQFPLLIQYADLHKPTLLKRRRDIKSGEPFKVLMLHANVKGN